MKKISVFMVIISISLLCFYEAQAMVAAVSIKCSGDTSVVCAKITGSGGTATAYGDKAVVVLD